MCLSVSYEGFMLSPIFLGKVTAKGQEPDVYQPHTRHSPVPTQVHVRYIVPHTHCNKAALATCTLISVTDSDKPLKETSVSNGASDKTDCELDR